MKNEEYVNRFKGEEHFEVVEKMKELYVTLRKRFILQYKTKSGESGYRVPTRSIKRGGEVVGYETLTLNDGWLYNHLKGSETIGIYSMKYFSKYICFDVDTEDRSREDTLNLVTYLEDLNISREDIHVSYSGDKGYHVEMFFDNLVTTDNLRMFYNKVINGLGFDSKKVEFRPSDSQGLKLPLGLHKRTGNRCWYVDNMTLNPIEDFNYVLGISQVSAEEFISEQCEREDTIILKEDEAVEFERLTEGFSIGSAELENLRKSIKEIIESNHLMEASTRNKYTLLISMYLKDEGYEQGVTERIINNVMINTKNNYPHLIDSSTSKIYRETRKIVRHTYLKGYTLRKRQVDVRIYKEELEDVLSVKKWEHKKLYLSMIVFAKRLGCVNGIFPMSYSMMDAMGNTKSISRSKKKLEELEKMGKIDIVSTNKIDVTKSEVVGSIRKEVNKYRIRKVFNQDGDSILIKDDEDGLSFEEIVSELFEEEELKALIPSSQYYNKFKNVIK